MLRVLVASPVECEEELRRIEVDEASIPIFADKRDSFLLKITDLSTPAANIIKQTALSFGADAAVHREVITGRIKRSDAIYMGTRRQLRRVALALSGQPFGLAALEEQTSALLDHLDNPPKAIELTAGNLTLARPLIMGALNVTPDSFSDGGEFFAPDDACKRIDEMCEEGADIVDVGAESSRPGSDPVSVAEQLKRLACVLKHLEKCRIIWSVDATVPDVVRAALDKGASIINDVSAGTDPSLWQLAGEYSAAYVLMHSQGTPKVMQADPHYDDFNAELFAFFHDRLKDIEASGFSRNRVILDPGIGFGKRLSDNTAAIRRLAELKSFGLPILLGASRKSFLGELLGAEVTHRLEGSIASAVLGYYNGASILRVHDVAATRKALDAARGIRSANGGCS